jgi:hypothetical protein
MKRKVRLRMVRWVDVEVEVAEDADKIDIEDAAHDLYYRGDVTFPEGSPSLEAEVLE